ncbi:MAG: metallophosphoesterase [Nocardioides sp.]
MTEDQAPTALPAWRGAIALGRPLVVRTLLCLGLAGVLSLPLAFSWAVTHTEVQQQIGTSPTTFSLTTDGHSELRLGIAGTVYVPRSEGPIGLIAQVEGPGDPGAGDGDLANYVRPEMLKLYTGLFHDPEAAIQEYVSVVQTEFKNQVILAEIILGGLGGLVFLGLSYLLPFGDLRSHPRPRLRAAGVALLTLVATSTLAWVQLTSSDAGSGPENGVYPLTALDGTAAAGSTTNSPVLRALLGGAFAKSKLLVKRQEAAEASYRVSAADDLESQRGLMTGALEGEVAVMMQSDMHCNITMIRLQTQVWSMLQDDFGDDAPRLLGVTGDLTTNGTAAEGTCIRDERAIAGDAPVVAVTGNHESDVSVKQMKDSGMTVLDGSTEEIEGVRLLGDEDPARSELFGGTALRGDETQQDVGTRLYEEARDGDRPDLVLVHEAYAAQAFLDVGPMRAFMDEAGDPTTPLEDDVRDAPAAAVFFGHWHESVPPRVVWNDDGTWTLVMELDTSGGAVDTPTITNFSTPWSSPRQTASFPVLFLDEDRRLITGYQIYRFEPDGEVVVEPRVDVGVPAPEESSGGRSKRTVGD